MVSRVKLLVNYLKYIHNCIQLPWQLNLIFKGQTGKTKNNMASFHDPS